MRTTRPEQRSHADREAPDPVTAGGVPAGRSRTKLAVIAWQVGLPVLGVLVTVLVWQWVTWYFEIRPLILPSPLEVARSLRQNWSSTLAHDSWVTTFETLAGFGFGAAGGLLGAGILSSSSALERATLPMVIALNSIPKVAVMPLLVVWFGFGHAPKIAMAATICFFPVMIATMAGLNSTPADLSELVRSLSASRWQHYRKVRIPWALPQIFVGLKLGMVLALIGAVVAELHRPGEGLGSVIQIATATGNMALSFAAIVLLMVISIALFYGIVLLERWLLPWSRETSSVKI